MIFNSFVVPCLLAAGLLATPATAAQQGTPEATPAPFSLSYVPRDTVLWLAIRPARLLEHKVLKLMADEIVGLAGESGLQLQEMESLTFAVPVATQFRPIMILRSRAASSFDELKTALDRGKSTKLNYRNIAFEKRRQTYLLQADPHTLVVAGSERTMKLAIDAADRRASPASWAEHWAVINKQPLAAIIDSARFRDLIGDEPPPGLFGRLVPLWEDTSTIAFSVHTEARLEIRGVATATTAAGGRAVESAAELAQRTFVGELTTVIDQIAVERQQMEHDAPESEQLELASVILPPLRDLVANGTIRLDGSKVRAKVAIGNASLGRVTGQLSTWMRRERQEIIAARKNSHLRELALAMHNYHDAYGHFPPASQMGKDDKGRHPVSWRVLLLPFLGHVEIFEAYRFDEPWNSPHNRKLTEAMPYVFRPAGTKRGTSTAYFAVVGIGKAKTAFAAHESRRIRDFQDGLSNSLLIVEAKRNTHWANPDDIIYDPEKPIPFLGGIAKTGFRFARADGSTGFITHAKAKASPELLRSFLTIDDGNVLDQSIYGSEPRDEGK